MKKNRLAIVISTGVAMLMAPPAFAVSSASARLGPISLTLYDLDPGDGITPWITFAYHDEYGNYAQASANDRQAGLFSDNDAWAANGWDPISASAGVPNASAAAQLSGSGSPTGTVLLAKGSALGVNPLGTYSSYSAHVVAPYYDYSSFRLSANTLMVLSASSALTSGVTASFDPALTEEAEIATADASLTLYGQGPSGDGYQAASVHTSIDVESTRYEDAACTWGYCYGPAGAADSRMLAISFTNASTGSLGGYLYASTSVYGESYALAVPEPGSVALMLAGLAAVGFVRRRRA